jgi:pSer/pThr/pTyr-binding forkhead associated (FHA) protein
MAAQFQFVMRSGPDVGKVFLLRAPEITIGRDNNNTITINDAEISRKHASMELRGTAYVIKDLGSTNGTFVNGQRLSSDHLLKPGDAVSFGEGIMLVYEAVYVANATAVSASAKAAKTVTPVQRPVPTPTPITVPPPAYSGQVPAGPVPVETVETKKKKKFPIWIIFLILLLMVICVCVGFFVIIDQFRLWCQVVPFLVPLLGGTCV